MKLQNVGNQQSFEAQAHFFPSRPRNLGGLVFPRDLKRTIFNEFDTDRLLQSLAWKVERREILIGADNIEPSQGYRKQLFFTLDTGDTLELSQDAERADMQPSMISIRHGENGQEGQTIIFRWYSHCEDKIYDKLATSLTNL